MIASGHVVTVAEDPVPLVADAQGVLHRQLVRLQPLQPLDVGHRQRLDPAVQGGRLPSVHRRVGWAGLRHDGVVCAGRLLHVQCVVLGLFPATKTER